MGILELVLITAPVWAILCAVVASSKKRSAGGWAFAGLLFGVLAFLVLALSRTAEPRVVTHGVPSRDPFKR